ncbi:MAG: hypothetical protein F6K47_28350 [Symploca sp. SIO2E6]|nr:hypothetical protein [Symploca sp. SIO2E6]
MSKWYYLPIGARDISLIGMTLLHYGLWIYWVGQSLKRCFRNPNATVLSKGQSYSLVACLEVIIVGFAVQEEINVHSYDFISNLAILSVLNLVMLFGLIALLSPQRQALQDWARYNQLQISRRRQEEPTPNPSKEGNRRQKSEGRRNPPLTPPRRGTGGRGQKAEGMKVASSQFPIPNSQFPIPHFQVRKPKTSLQELVWGEKSPAMVAIGINLAIATTPILLWIVLQSVEKIDKTKVLFGVAFFASWIMIYATLVQLILMMKTPKRSLWAAGTVAAIISLPVIILAVLEVFPDENPTLWLFSTFPWAGLEYGTASTVFMALLGQGIVLALLNLQLTRQLKLAGESATKALLTSGNNLTTS